MLAQPLADVAVVMRRLCVHLAPDFGRKLPVEPFVDAVEVFDLEVLERLVGRAVPGQISALGQKDDLVAEHHVLRRVSHEHDCVPLVGQGAQEPHHLALCSRVEAGRRLVKKEEARLHQ